MTAKARVKARIEKAKRRANECSDRVVASRHMCYGCEMDYYCDVSAKFNAMRKAEREARSLK